jgi:hypothetical protein
MNRHMQCHLVSGRKYPGRYFDAKRLCLKIDHHLVLVGRVYGQVARLRALRVRSTYVAARPKISVGLIPPKFLQCQRKRGDAGLPFGRLRLKIHQHAYSLRPGKPLRASSERPHSCAADQCNELAAPHRLPRSLWIDHRTALRQRRLADYDRQTAMGWILAPQIPICTAAIKLG